MCWGEGVLRWRQPCPDGVLRDLEHPCPNGCGPGWRLPSAENCQVIDPGLDSAADDDRPVRAPGRADQVNQLGGAFVADALETWGFER